YRPSEDVESRWFFGASDSDSELPGNLTKARLRTDPRRANPGNVALNQQRDLRLYRLANRTVYRFGDSQLEFGGYVMHRSLFHPLFQLLDIHGNDFGLFVRYASEGTLFGFPQRWTVGFEPQATRQTDRRFVNVGGKPGQQTADGRQTATNLD